LDETPFGVSVSNFKSSTMNPKTFDKMMSKMRSNVSHWHDMATDDVIQDGVAWYDEAKGFALMLSNEFDVSPLRAGGVISALSPRNKWERNKIDAWNVFQAVQDDVSHDRVKVSTFNSNKVRAFNIAKGLIQVHEASRKTHRFALNVGAFDMNAVTIDTWMLYCFQTKSKTRKNLDVKITPKQYDLLERKFQRISYDMGYAPAHLQAVVWLVIRELWT